MATTKVVVKAPKIEGLTHYFRAGLKLARGAENVVEVDEKQLAALKADGQLLVSDFKPKEETKK